MTKQKTKEPLIEDLYLKYPTLKGELSKHWRSIIRKALQGQVNRNPKSSSLRGISQITKNYFPIYLEPEELRKVQKIISQRFQSAKNDPDWDEYRELLPNIFAEKYIGNLSWFEDSDGIPDSVSMIDEKEKKISDGCAVIIIQDGNFKAEYANVPSDVALTINAELSKALS